MLYNYSHEHKTPTQIAWQLPQAGWPKNRATECYSTIRNCRRWACVVGMSLFVQGQNGCPREIAQPYQSIWWHTLLRVSSPGNSIETKSPRLEQRQDIRHRTTGRIGACVHPEAFVVKGCNSSERKQVRAVRMEPRQVRHPSYCSCILRRDAHDQQRIGTLPELSPRTPRKGVAR